MSLNRVIFLAILCDDFSVLATANNQDRAGFATRGNTGNGPRGKYWALKTSKPQALERKNKIDHEKVFCSFV